VVHLDALCEPACSVVKPCRRAQQQAACGSHDAPHLNGSRLRGLMEVGAPPKAMRDSRASCGGTCAAALLAGRMPTECVVRQRRRIILSNGCSARCAAHAAPHLQPVSSLRAACGAR
jgi:hypothetical protein